MRFLIFLIGFWIALAGCKEVPPAEALLQNMVVQTTKEEFTDYSFYESFTLSPDTLGLYANYTRDTFFVNDYSIAITAQLKSEMQQAGYTFKPRNQDPDLGIAATVVDNYNVYQQLTFPNYYTGYYGFGYGGYFGPIVSTFQVSSSILVINLIDLKNRDAEGRLRVIWQAYMGDLLQSANPDTKVLEAIDQAFKQSPYLQRP
jgi:hypothetical protein